MTRINRLKWMLGMVMLFGVVSVALPQTTEPPIAPTPPTPVATNDVAAPNNAVKPRADVRFMPGAGRPDTVAIVAIVGAFVLAGFGAYLRHKRAAMVHETVRLMVEKGMPIPPELLIVGNKRVTPAVRNDLRRGLILGAIGAGLVLTHSPTAKAFGWVFIFVGIAYVVNWLIEKNTKGSNPPQV